MSRPVVGRSLVAAFYITLGAPLQRAWDGLPTAKPKDKFHQPGSAATHSTSEQASLILSLQCRGEWHLGTAQVS